MVPYTAFIGAAPLQGDRQLRKRLIIVVVVAVSIAAFFALGLGDYLTLDYLQASRARAAAYIDSAPLTASAAFFGAYVVVTGLSLPGAAVLTIAAGAIFGLGWGLLLVSFASSIGATIAFLVARSLLGDWVQRRFGDYLEPINRGLERDGNFYLFTLRMVPLFPFFVINLLMGLTRIGVVPFYLVSQLGMLAGTFVFVFAGTQLANVHAVRDVLSPGMIAALTLLGAFPLLARKLLAIVTRRRREIAR
jgi:uncharacterized membrane protein YdjX (TVP38/TMEM64 family)